MSEGNDKHIEIPNFLIDYFSGEISTSENEKLISWLNSSADNKRIFDEFSDIWLAGLISKSKTSYDETGSWKLMKQEIVNDRRTAKFLYISLAKYAAIGVVIIALSIGGYLEFRRSVVLHSVSYQEIIVPYGSRSQIDLPDGSKVWLNAGSRLKYSNRFNSQSREIFFDGEGYFEVAKNGKIPFIVQVPGAKIKVTGTIFNIKAYCDDNFIQASVVTGEVTIYSEVEKNGKAKQLNLEQNQIAVFEKVRTKNISNTKDSSLKDKSIVTTLVKSQTIVNIEKYTSWREGRLIIEHEKLGELAVKLERRYNVKIIFSEPKVKDYIFSGILQDETLYQVLKVISFTAPIKYTIDKDKVLLSEDKMLKNKVK